MCFIDWCVPTVGYRVNALVNSITSFHRVLFGVTLPKFFDDGNSTSIQERVAGYSSWIEVDLDAIGFNLEQVRKMTGSEVVPCIGGRAFAGIERTRQAIVID